MNKTESYLQSVLLSRFADRQNIGKEGLYASYFANLPRLAVLECLSLIEEEYKVPAGLLRPEDKLTKLSKHVETKNPWHWLIYQVRAGDSEFELQYQLQKRLRQHGTNEAWEYIETFGDFVRAWCGQKPE